MKVVMSTSDPHNELLNKLNRWKISGRGKTANKDIIWFPKPRTELTDMRNMLKIAFEKQQENKNKNLGDYFEENELSIDLAAMGSITRPGVSTSRTVTDYQNEQTANKPHVSSFRMSNRIYRLLGLVTRDLSGANRYVVTDLGQQYVKFDGPFPSKIDTLSECDFIVKRLVNANIFSVHDLPSMWDTRFRNRIVVNLLRCTAEYGYITNHEAVVTAFALKDERDPKQIEQMLTRLRKLHNNQIDMIQAYQECNVDPFDSSATNNAYDSPKVLTSLCRQTGLFERDTVGLKESPKGDLTPIYKKMYDRDSKLKKPNVVNILTDYGKNILNNEMDKRLIGFEELY